MTEAPERLEETERAKHLRAHIARWKEAERIRRFSAAAEAARPTSSDGAEWLTWAEPLRTDSIRSVRRRMVPRFRNQQLMRFSLTCRRAEAPGVLNPASTADRHSDLGIRRAGQYVGVVPIQKRTS